MTSTAQATDRMMTFTIREHVKARCQFSESGAFIAAWCPCCGTLLSLSHTEQQDAEEAWATMRRQPLPAADLDDANEWHSPDGIE